MIFSAKYLRIRKPGKVLSLFAFVLFQFSAGQVMAANVLNQEMSSGARSQTSIGPLGQAQGPILLKKRKYPAVRGLSLQGRKVASYSAGRSKARYHNK